MICSQIPPLLIFSGISAAFGGNFCTCLHLRLKFGSLYS